MIHCPYCGSQMNDEARSCPRCKSLLIGEHREYRAEPFPKILHPLAAIIAIAVISAGLVFAGGLEKKKPAPGKQGNTPRAAALTGGAATTGEAAKPDGGNGMEAAGPDGFKRIDVNPSSMPDRPVRGANRPPGLSRDDRPVGPAPTESYEQVAAYDVKVREIVREVENLTSQIETLFAKKDEAGQAAISDFMGKVRDSARGLRTIDPPRSVQRSHTRIANSFAMELRGYRGLMGYTQSGDISKFDEARKDIDGAKTMRQAALDEISALLAGMKPGTMTAPAPEPAGGVPGEAPQAEPGAEPASPPEHGPHQRERGERPPRPALIPPTAPEITDDGRGDSVYEDYGDSADAEYGDSVYPEYGDSVYPENGDSAYNGYEEPYPGNGETYPP